jgi:hypothetical protein
MIFIYNLRRYLILIAEEGEPFAYPVSSVLYVEVECCVVRI